MVGRGLDVGGWERAGHGSSQSPSQLPKCHPWLPNTSRDRSIIGFNVVVATSSLITCHHHHQWHHWLEKAKNKVYGRFLTKLELISPVLPSSLPVNYLTVIIKCVICGNIIELGRFTGKTSAALIKLALKKPQCSWSHFNSREHFLGHWYLKWECTVSRTFCNGVG